MQTQLPSGLEVVEKDEARSASRSFAALHGAECNTLLYSWPPTPRQNAAESSGGSCATFPDPTTSLEFPCQSHLCVADVSTERLDVLGARLGSLDPISNGCRLLAIPRLLPSFGTFDKFWYIFYSFTTARSS